MATEHYKKTEILIGPASSGKTQFARKAAEGKKVKFYEGRKIAYKRLFDNPFFFSELDGDEELLVFDDVPINLLHQLLDWLFDPNITIHRQGQKSFTVPRPRVIITAESEDYKLPDYRTYTRRYALVKFPGAIRETPKEEYIPSFFEQNAIFGNETDSDPYAP